RRGARRRPAVAAARTLARTCSVIRIILSPSRPCRQEPGHREPHHGLDGLSDARRPLWSRTERAKGYQTLVVLVALAGMAEPCPGGLNHEASDLFVPDRGGQRLD